MMSTSGKSTVISLSALAAIAVLFAANLLYAGPLNPPAGPVASTAKTLTEVEPRIAINAVNTPGDADSLYRITQAGSYGPIIDRRKLVSAAVNGFNTTSTLNSTDPNANFSH